MDSITKDPEIEKKQAQLDYNQSSSLDHKLIKPEKVDRNKTYTKF